MKKTRLTIEQQNDVEAFMQYMHDAYDIDTASLAVQIMHLYYVPKSKMELKSKLKRQEAGLHNMVKEL